MLRIISRRVFRPSSVAPLAAAARPTILATRTFATASRRASSKTRSASKSKSRTASKSKVRSRAASRLVRRPVSRTRVASKSRRAGSKSKRVRTVSVRAKKAADKKEAQREARRLRMEARRDRRERMKAEQRARRAAQREKQRERKLQAKEKEREKKQRVKEREYIKKYRAEEKVYLTKMKAKAAKYKDPETPTRARTAYNLYFTERYAVLSKQSTEKQAVTTIAKAVAAEWKGLSDEQKKAYTEKAAQDKARYESEMKEYQKKVPQAPSRPLTPYMRFVVERRPAVVAANPELAKNIGQLGKRMAEEWRALSQEEKDKYTKEFDADVVKYQAARLEYVTRLTEQLPQEFRDQILADEKAKPTSLKLLPGLISQYAKVIKDAEAKSAQEEKEQ